MLLRNVALATALLVVITPSVLADEPGSDRSLMLDASRQHGPMIVHERHGTNVSSDNWAGYAVTGSKGSVTDVKATWTVPAIVGTCPSTDQYASFWVGIDGYSSSTVEQIGTDSDCTNGKPVYYAWFEFYPHPSFNIKSLAIQPGNTISAEVEADGGGKFTVTLTNETTQQTFSTSTKIKSADQSSAEWIAEAPSGGGIASLADFGSISFTGPNTATIETVTRPIGSFPANEVYEITMVGSTGAPKALPSVLTSSSAFSVTWASAGP
jgi:hypothetical protein